MLHPLSDFGAARKERDKRLRRRMLSTLRLARAMSPKGGLSGRSLRDNVDGVMPTDQQTENDEHALGLLRDMTAKGYFEESPLPRRRGQSFGLDYLFYRITARGVSLWEESIPPDPDVDDDRIADDA